MQVLLSFVSGFKWLLTFDNMKRLGFRSASLSTVDEVDLKNQTPVTY